jgi:succinyl-CoA synthetase alpha subunit
MEVIIAVLGGVVNKELVAGINALGADPATKVIVLISKPPSPDVTRNVMAAAVRSGKPVVVDFIGADAERICIGEKGAADDVFGYFLWRFDIATSNSDSFSP